MKLLVTSVGSLVGKNILDVLEYPGLSRRDLVRVVGTNSVADAANNFRCDRCYLVPETASDEYHAQVREILLKESPDLILCGRDEDTLALSELRAQPPGLPGALPVGSARDFVSGARFPEIRPPGSETCNRVIRDVVAIAVAAAPVSALKATGVWSRSRET